MEKAIVKQIQSFLPQIVALSKRKESVSFDYDKKADVLYVSFQRPQKATDSEMINDDIILRKQNGSIVGLTIMHASKFK